MTNGEEELPLGNARIALSVVSGGGGVPVGIGWEGVPVGSGSWLIKGKKFQWVFEWKE